MDASGSTTRIIDRLNLRNAMFLSMNFFEFCYTEFQVSCFRDLHSIDSERKRDSLISSSEKGMGSLSLFLSLECLQIRSERCSSNFCGRSEVMNGQKTYSVYSVKQVIGKYFKNENLMQQMSWILCRSHKLFSKNELKKTSLESQSSTFEIYYKK